MNNPFELTNKQHEAMSVIGRDATNILLEGGSRSGKTFLIMRVLVQRALAAPGSRHAVLRFRFNHVKASIVHDTFPKVMELCFPDTTYHLDKTDWFAHFPGGSQIWFSGLDDKDRTEKILGQEYSTLFFNECSQIPLASRNLAMTRLAQRSFYYKHGAAHELRLKAFYDCNPPSKAHWCWHYFHDKNDPESRKPLRDPDSYTYFRINPEDNRENLPESYFKQLDSLPARMRKRFFLGEYADATPNALWTIEGIEKSRVTSAKLPDYQRVIVGVDPSGASSETADADEIGIGVGALGADGVAYFLEDLTLRAAPAQWGEVAGSAYDRHGADLTVGEENFGGAMVEHVIKTARPTANYKAVKASRGKVIRAEPISALCEQGKIKFVGEFPQLESELCSFSTAGYTGEGSPNRADAFIWVMSELFPGIVSERRKWKPLVYQSKGIV